MLNYKTKIRKAEATNDEGTLVDVFKIMELVYDLYCKKKMKILITSWTE